MRQTCLIHGVIHLQILIQMCNIFVQVLKLFCLIHLTGQTFSAEAARILFVRRRTDYFFCCFIQIFSLLDFFFFHFSIQEIFFPPTLFQSVCLPFFCLKSISLFTLTDIPIFLR